MGRKTPCPQEPGASGAVDLAHPVRLELTALVDGRATGFEALVGAWCLDGEPGVARLHEVLGAPLEEAIDEAVAAAGQRLRRG